jgi:hypothetical protein
MTTNPKRNLDAFTCITRVLQTMGHPELSEFTNLIW